MSEDLGQEKDRGRKLAVFDRYPKRSPSDPPRICTKPMKPNKMEVDALYSDRKKKTPVEKAEVESSKKPLELKKLPELEALFNKNKTSGEKRKTQYSGRPLELKKLPELEVLFNKNKPPVEEKRRAQVSRKLELKKIPELEALFNKSKPLSEEKRRAQVPRKSQIKKIPELEALVNHKKISANAQKDQNMRKTRSRSAASINIKGVPQVKRMKTEDHGVRRNLFECDKGAKQKTKCVVNTRRNIQANKKRNAANKKTQSENCLNDTSQLFNLEDAENTLKEKRTFQLPLKAAGPVQKAVKTPLREIQLEFSPEIPEIVITPEHNSDDSFLRSETCLKSVKKAAVPKMWSINENGSSKEDCLNYLISKIQQEQEKFSALEEKFVAMEELFFRNLQSFAEYRGSHTKEMGSILAILNKMINSDEVANDNVSIKPNLYVSPLMGQLNNLRVFTLNKNLSKVRKVEVNVSTAQRCSKYGKALERYNIIRNAGMLCTPKIGKNLPKSLTGSSSGSGRKKLSRKVEKQCRLLEDQECMS